MAAGGKQREDNTEVLGEALEGNGNRKELTASSILPDGASFREDEASLGSYQQIITQTVRDEHLT